MDTICKGVCLFCMEKAQESYSNHGRSFDGYYCSCVATKNYRKVIAKAAAIIKEAETPARANREALQQEEKRKELLADIKKSEEELLKLEK